ncbi:MAG: lipid A phosphate methyltransferase [Flexibacter sp. CG_4_10_14_3_um_filter_32_15]|nr:MAG: lipid A phosphate methyltransferase [Flexibacter sp. CG_4_10_14_3_um_filter_32_15]
MALIEELDKEGNFLFKHRGTLPIPFVFVALGLYAWQAQNQGFPKWFPYYEYVCLAVGLLGQFVRAYTVGHTPKGTSGRNTKKQVAETLNTSGIYSAVRHPLYVGNFLMWLGVAMLTANFWFITCFVLAYWLYYERIMYAEEYFLRNKFGQQYLDWASTVPPFIPRFSSFDGANLEFSAKNVLKREYNGFFALMLIFTVFIGIRFYFKTFMYGLPNEWYVIFGVSLLIFGTLKILKKFTKVLDVKGR